MQRSPSLCAVLVVLAAFVGRASAAEFSAADLDFFEAKVRPLLASNCFSCHANGKSKRRPQPRLARNAMLKGGDSGSPPSSPATRTIVRSSSPCSTTTR